uniref:SMP-30/gluconolactonase/LRE family protein n=1 Tax=Ningiella ruwaisensis TaxID=2364274 RepID=UPI0010A08531|nr:SMP-30/gluconolactonase/LRE family protein [Ningiella ruwaisensis]
MVNISSSLAVALRTLSAFSLFFVLGFAFASQAKDPPYIEILDDKALKIVDANAEFKVLGSGYSWSEGPVWVEDGGYLLFSDVPENTIYQYRPGQEVTPYLTPSGATGIDENDSSQGANGLLINDKGQLVIMQHGDRRVAIMDSGLDAPADKFISLASTFDGKRFNSPNDAIFHSNGDLYFTDPPYGLKDREKDRQLDFDGIFRVTADGTVILEDDSVRYPNGIVLTNDEQRMIVAASDRENASWYQYDVADDGSLLNKRVFYDVSDLAGKPGEQGLPDGMVVHSSGHIFATGPGGVYLFTEDGELLAKYRTGKATANVTLSADEKHLYMTAHDQLMSIALK